MDSLVHVKRYGDIAVIEIDNPPANALCGKVRQDLLAALHTVQADAALRAAVLTGAGRDFIAGADIREFDHPPAAPTTADICAALDAATKPVVAALHGMALGEGFEIALACHARVMAPDGHAGLPEARLGLIPSAGGTQRLPRLAGAPAALDLLASGRHVAADEALRLGLVDEIATSLREAAAQRARGLADARHWPVTAARKVPTADRAAFAAATDKVRKRARGALAPVAAAEAVGWALDLPFAEGLEREQASARELRGGPQCRALRHIYHAERVAARLSDGASRPPGTWPLRIIGVVGGGTMGAGIAVALAEAGLETRVIEVSAEASAAAEARIRALHARHTHDQQAERLSRITHSTHLERLRDCDLVIEAVAENMDLKRDVFRRLSAVTRRDCILASNTSNLDIDRLAHEVDAPERVLGLHFFSPAHVMRLLEIVRGDRTLPEVLATALALARRLRKQPVIARVCEGFIGNRILARWWAQCDFMLEEGAFPEQIDAALEKYGFAMGPYAVADLAGLDIVCAGRHPPPDPRIRHVGLVEALHAEGRLGQKSGAGWYRHEGGKRLSDPHVHALIEQASAAAGRTRRAIPDTEIQRRVLAAMVNEGAKIVAEGIAQRPSDIDVVLVHGYGFPAWRGGPIYAADTEGLAAILAEVEATHARDGLGWEPARLLQELVATRRGFATLNV